MPAASAAVAPAFFDREAPDASAEPATLIVGEDGPVVTLAGSRYEIGRTAECDIQIEDANISRRHAALVAEEGGWAVEDLGSTNGTWLRGEKVQRAALNDGDIVTIGATRLFLRTGER